MPGERAHNLNRVIPFRLWRRSHRLVACSVCLRVRWRGAWVEAGEVIGRPRTFEHDDVLRLGGALCQHCEMELRLRRRSDSEELAA
jgi:hypothetical protein